MINVNKAKEFNKEFSLLIDDELNDLLKRNSFNEFETHLSNIPYIYFFGLDTDLFNKGVKLINNFIKISEAKKRFTYRLLTNYILKTDKELYEYIGSNVCDCIDTYNDSLNGILSIFEKADMNIKTNVFNSFLNLVNSNEIDDKLKFRIVNTYYSHKLYGSNCLLGHYYEMSNKDNSFDEALKYYAQEPNKNDFNLFLRMSLIYAYFDGYINYAKANQCFKKSLAINNGENFKQYADFLRLFDKYKNIPLAISYYKRSIELNYKPALIGLASIYAYEPNYLNYKRAIELLDKLPDCKEKFLEKGKVYFESRDFDEAIKNYKESLKYEKDGLTYNCLGDIYINEKSSNYDLAKAEKYYKKAVESGLKYAAFSLGKMYDQIKHDNYEANKYFKIAMTDKTFLGLEGRVDYASFLTGKHKYRDIDKAISILNNILDEADYAPAKVKLIAIYLNYDGYIDFDKAYNYLESCPKIGATYYFLGKLHIGKGKYFDLDKAIKCYIKAGDLGIRESYYCLGTIYYDGKHISKDYEKAKEYFLKSIPSSFDEDTYFMLGNIYAFSNDYDDVITAIKYYKKSGDDKFVWANLGYLYQYCLNNIDTAIKYYKKACNENHDAAFFFMGTIYLDRNTKYYDVNLAFQYFEKVLKLPPCEYLDTNGLSFRQKSYCMIGLIYLSCPELKNEEKALLNFKKAHSEEANIYLVEYYCEKKDFESALKYALETLDFKRNGACDYLIEYIYKSFDDISISQINKVIEKLKPYNTSEIYKIIGDIYKYPNIVCYNINKSFKYYLKAIVLDKNNGKANYALGYCYYYGQGVGKDLNKAKHYFEIASKNGNKCSHIIEIINTELGIEHTNSKMKKVLNTKTTFKQIKNFIEKTFALTRVDENVKSDLVTALSIYVSLAKAQINESIKLDFSPCINLLFKSLENIIRKYFIDEYRNYLFDKIPSYRLSKNKYFTTYDENGVCIYKDHGKFDKFTLQDFDKIIGLNKFERRPMLHDKNKFINTNMLSNYDGSTICVDEVFLEYLANELFSVYSMNQYKNKDEYINYLILLDNYIHETVDIYRNPATHYEIMSKEKAEAIINDFLFEEKILIDFYNKLRL